MKPMFFKFALTAAGALLSLPTLGQEQILEATTNNGQTITLEFAERAQAATETALICGGLSDVTEAKLWMEMPNGHAHGSTPTTLAVEGDCFRVQAINFTMTGVWEIQTTFADGDYGVFYMDVVHSVVVDDSDPNAELILLSRPRPRRVEAALCGIEREALTTSTLTQSSTGRTANVVFGELDADGCLLVSAPDVRHRGAWIWAFQFTDDRRLEFAVQVYRR